MRERHIIIRCASIRTGMAVLFFLPSFLSLSLSLSLSLVQPVVVALLQGTIGHPCT